jgi:hypothetical protein
MVDFGSESVEIVWLDIHTCSVSHYFKCLYHVLYGSCENWDGVNELLCFITYRIWIYQSCLNSPTYVTQSVTSLFIDNCWPQSNDGTVRLLQDTERMVCLVPELCYLTGLTDAMRNDFQVMKDISMYTRITPNQRQAAIKKFITNIQGKKKGMLSSHTLSQHYCL